MFEPKKTPYRKQKVTKLSENVAEIIRNDDNKCFLSIGNPVQLIMSIVKSVTKLKPLSFKPQ